MKKRLIPLFASVALLAAGASSCGETEKWSWEKATADGEFGYIVCIGEDGNPEAIDRTQGCKDAIEEICKDAGLKPVLLEEHICVDNAGSWSDTEAQNFVTRAVTQFAGRLDFIVSNNDGMAVAASTANGLTPGTPIVGFDALSSACDMIINGSLAGSVSQNGDDQALIVATMLGNMVAGNDPIIDKNYGGRAEIVLDDLDQHLVSTKLTAVTATNAAEMKPGNFVTGLDEISGLSDKNLLVVEYNATDNFIQETFHKALPHYAEALGFGGVDTIQGDGNNDTGLQDLLRNQLKTKTYSAVALNVITHTNYQQYLNIIRESDTDLPVVFFNRQPMADKDKTADISGIANTYFVGSSSSGQGTAQGQIIKDWYNNLTK